MKFIRLTERNPAGGFTFIELLIVICMLFIVSGMTMFQRQPAWQRAIERGDEPGEEHFAPGTRNRNIAATLRGVTQQEIPGPSRSPPTHRICVKNPPLFFAARAQARQRQHHRNEHMQWCAVWTEDCFGKSSLCLGRLQQSRTEYSVHGRERGCFGDRRCRHAALGQLERRKFLCLSLPDRKTVAADTTFRLAISGGKGIPFKQPTVGAPPDDFGTDGGTHNFLRYLEDWGNGAPAGTLWYEGSIVSMYYNHQAVGTYKCCSTVYNPPVRAYVFDTNFLMPNLLPPLMPMLRAINTIGFTQILLPTQ